MKSVNSSTDASASAAQQNNASSTIATRFITAAHGASVTPALLPRGTEWTEWHQSLPLKERHFHNSLDRMLNGMTESISRDSKVPYINVPIAPWLSSSVATHIPPYDKATATEKHRECLQTTLEDPENLLIYTDGPQGARTADGVVATRAGTIRSRLGSRSRWRWDQR